VKKIPLVLAACAGFLLGVLWMDLMFDVQALVRGGAVPEPALASIAAYYRRVTTDAWPMSVLIGGVMTIAVAGSLVEVVRVPGLRSATALLLIAAPVALGFGRVLPNAVRLGLRGDPAALQAALAQGIARDHLVCLVAVTAFLALQLGSRRRRAASDGLRH
jgi:hypothetical protein